MPGRAVLVFVLSFAVVLLSACGPVEGDVGMSWETRDGLPLSVDIGTDENHATVVTIENDSGETIRDAVLRFSPSTTRNAPVGFSVGTASSVRTEFEGDAHLWRLGDIAPNTRMIFALSLWFETAGQLHSAPPIDLVMTLESTNLGETLTGVLTVQFQRRDAAGR